MGVSTQAAGEDDGAEVLLKLLAHNISRLLARTRLFCVFFLLEAPASLDA